MKRFPIRSLVSMILIVSAAACSLYSGSVAVTKSESVVAGCQKVGEVSTGKLTPDSEVADALSEAARRKGGNYVLVDSDGARAGQAYLCKSSSVASR